VSSSWLWFEEGLRCVFHRVLTQNCYLAGKRPLADVWALDTAAKPYEWRKLDPEGDGPPPCIYATASARSDGLLLLSGGRDANSVVRAMNRHLLISRTSSSIPGRLIGKVVVACSHLILHMDLQSIETDGGSGLSLLASHLLQDTNMQQCL
jgi:hypothetical protein